MSTVIKLGGSLLTADCLPSCLQAVTRQNGRPIIIVPGGGPFADQVRVAQQHWQFDDVAAHRMAILAMQQMALLMQALQPSWPIVHDWQALLAAPDKVSIWSPCYRQLDADGVPASWDISSDSLAAWLAGHIAAEALVLVKAAAFANHQSLQQLQASGIIDAAFLNVTAASRYKISVINQASFCSSHD